MALARLSILQSSLFLSDTNSDDEMKYALNTATSLAGKYTGRVKSDGITNALESATYTDELYSGEDAPKDAWGYRHKLYLRNYPVTAVSAVKIWDGSSYVTETSTYYELQEGRFIDYPKLGQESSATYGGWPCGFGRRNIKVTYTAGYVTTDWATALITASFAVPTDLEHAIAAWAADLWLSKGQRAVSSESFGPRAVTYVTRNGVACPANVAEVLDGYVRVEF